MKKIIKYATVTGMILIFLVGYVDAQQRGTIRISTNNFGLMIDVRTPGSTYMGSYIVNPYRPVAYPRSLLYNQPPVYVIPVIPQRNVFYYPRTRFYYPRSNCWHDHR